MSLSSNTGGKGGYGGDRTSGQPGLQQTGSGGGGAGSNPTSDVTLGRKEQKGDKDLMKI